MTGQYCTVQQKTTVQHKKKQIKIAMVLKV